MFERLFCLLERFVSAVETLASTPAGRAVIQAGIVAATRDAGPAPDPADRPVAAGKYDHLSLDQLKTACGLRGISVPPRTRADTMVKLLEAADVAAPAASAAPTPTAPTAPAAPAPDPFAAADAPDPFADAAPTLTEADVRAKLQKVLAAHGVAKVAEILKSTAHVSKVTELKPEHYAAVAAAADAAV